MVSISRRYSLVQKYPRYQCFYSIFQRFFVSQHFRNCFFHDLNSFLCTGLRSQINSLICFFKLLFTCWFRGVIDTAEFDKTMRSQSSCLSWPLMAFKGTILKNKQSMPGTLLYWNFKKCCRYRFESHCFRKKI